MAIDLREQACWLALVFESGLTIRIVDDILVIWCKQLNRTLQDFFAASTQEWEVTCQLNAKVIEKLKQAKEKLVAQAFVIEQLEHAHIHLVTVLDSEYPLKNLANILSSLVPESEVIRTRQNVDSVPPNQSSLLVL